MGYILVVGGGGFLGSHVAGQLAARKTHPVVVADMFGEGTKWKNLANHAIHELISPSTIFYWLDMYGEKLDAVIHLASIREAEGNVDLMLESHFSQAMLLFKWCAENGKRFIWGSTSATYGDGSNGADDHHETAYLNALRPLTASAWSKHRFDAYACAAYENKEIVPAQWACLKFSHIYGPNEYDKGSDASIVTRLLANKTPLGVRDANQAIDFMYAKDAANALLWFIDKPNLSGVFNVGSGEVRTLSQAADIVTKMLGEKRTVANDASAPVLAVPSIPTDIGKLRATGYTQPMIALEQGVVDYIQHYWLGETCF